MIKAYLYDSDGHDREIDVPATLPELAEHHLLWLDVTGRDKAELTALKELLALDGETLTDLASDRRRLSLNNYGAYFQCDILTLKDNCPPKHKEFPVLTDTVRLDLIAGTNWFVTVADEPLRFLAEFRDRDRGETMIGDLSAPSFAAAILDGHLTVFLQRADKIEELVDGLDVHVLAGTSVDQALLPRIIAGRRAVARLRRTLAPQAVVFYGLSRPDFAIVADSHATQHYASLEHRFERTLDALEHNRELIQGSFELFTTRIAESTNVLLRRLTLVSIMLGVVGAVAGVFGMNFQTPYTATGVVGFWAVLGALLLLIVAVTAIGRWRRWI